MFRGNNDIPFSKILYYIYRSLFSDSEKSSNPENFFAYIFDCPRALDMALLEFHASISSVCINIPNRWNSFKH